MERDVIIIGAGLSGLACSLRLAASGYRVLVLESNEGPGGKISKKRARGYRFDTGASLLTIPGLVDDLLDAAGVEERVGIRQLDVICKYFYSDGTIINAFRDTGDFATEIQKKTGEKRESVLAFLRNSRYLYELTKDTFIFSPFRTLSNMFSRSAFNVLLHFRALDAFRSMYEKNSRWFSDARTRQLFNRYATYSGSNPYTAPATLNIIAHLEHGGGAYLPEGGMFSLIQVLYKSALAKGVEFKFKTRAEKIITGRKGKRGVEAGGGTIQSNIVVSDADIFSVYSRLLGRKKVPGYLLRQELSSSAIIFFWGIKNTYPVLETHNILFSGDYESEFKYIFQRKAVYDDPTIYIYVSSKIMHTDAPSGCENWFVMINSPVNEGQDWDRCVEEARSKIISKINKTLDTDIESFIEFEDIADPRTIEKNSSSFKGALYGNSSNNKMAAFFRHPNFMCRFKGLFFTGGSVHPGGGIPLCLASAKIVADKIIKSHTLKL
jgi:phytoene desaturase